VSDEPFGRQPKPVRVIIAGTDPIDVSFWKRELMRLAQYKGDDVEEGGTDYSNAFMIYPRAVND
jgi:hypothetical protein